MDCLFCKIIVGEIPSEKTYEDEEMLTFKNINPQAPVHFLLVPKKHIKSADDLGQEDAGLIGYIFLRVAEIAGSLGCENRYRIVNNCREDEGQGVDHLHLHVLRQRSLQWPLGWWLRTLA